MAGTVTRLGGAIYQRGAISVVAHHGLRSLHQLSFRQGAHGNHVAAPIPHVNAFDIVDALAKRGLGLQIDLPGAAKNIEVIDVVTAECGLQCIEDIADLDAEHLRLVAIDIEVNLRCVGGVGAEHTGELGLAVGGHKQAAKHGGEIVW